MSKAIKHIIILLFIALAQTSFSQGKIRVYFNQSVNNSISPTYDAIHSTNIQDTIIAYIDRSTVSLDVCNYNTSRSDIIDAINNAYLRGVNVRYVASKDVPFRNTKLSDLNSNIGVIQRSGGFPGDDEMHNKFIVIDQSDVQRATIISGSMNHTNSSIEDDYNNLVIIQDQALAGAYKIEFEEMWGSNTLNPNTSNSKFGSQKSDNTAHSFTIDGKLVELYFSPTDDVISHVRSAIQTADSNVDVAMMTFKDNLVAQEIIDKHNLGVQSFVLMESSSGSSEYSNLLAAGVPSFLNNQSGILHHKYAIIDASDISSDPIVITGSQNWNDNTGASYDDNTLIIHDHGIAQQYLEEFNARKTQIASVDIATNNHFTILNNPVVKNLTVNADSDNAKMYLFNSLGKLCLQATLKTGNNDFDLTNKESGIYFLRVTTINSDFTEKILLK